MKDHRLLAVSSLFLDATVSAGVAGRAVVNAEVDDGTVPSRLETLVGDGMLRKITSMKSAIS